MFPVLIFLKRKQAMKKTTFAAMAIALMCATPAFANHDKMDMMDANKDGSVSKAEYDTFKNNKFNEMDTNKDGSLSKDEMKAAHESKMEKWKDKMKDKMDMDDDR